MGKCNNDLIIIYLYNKEISILKKLIELRIDINWQNKGGGLLDVYSS